LINEFKVSNALAVAFGYNFVSIAKQAEVFTKRQVNIDRQGFETRQDALASMLERLGVVARAKARFELIKAWV
jgi:hypothetical protein